MNEEKISLASEYGCHEVKIGDHFSFKGFEWVALDATEEGGVFAIMANCWKEVPFDNKRNWSNNYATSTLRKMLNEELLPILGEENLLPHVVDLTADNGDDRYGTVTDKVFILSCDEYRKYRKLVPLLEEWSWTCTPWYISPYSGSGSSVRIVDTTGYLSINHAYNSYGVAPACIIHTTYKGIKFKA